MTNYDARGRRNRPVRPDGVRRWRKLSGAAGRKPAANRSDQGAGDDQYLVMAVALFPVMRLSNCPAYSLICIAWALNSSEADAASSALAAFCWVDLSIS